MNALAATLVYWVSFAGILYLVKIALCLLLELLHFLRAHILPALFPTSDLRPKYGHWAVVVGANDPLIKNYARELARKKMNVILISRELRDISDTAAAIESEFPVKTKCIAVDFREGKSVYDNIKQQLTGMDIGILVNGVDNRQKNYRQFIENSVQDLWDTIDNNMCSVAMMTSVVLPAMIAKNRGKIVNVSSMAALNAHPNSTAVDSATKAFSLFLSRSTEYELKEFNIEVQTLTPNTVLSDPGNAFMFNVPSYEAYAKSAVNSIDWCSDTTGHWFHTVFRFIKDNCPSIIWAAVSEAGRVSTEKHN